jgi:hypothetical protein
MPTKSSWSTPTFYHTHDRGLSSAQHLSKRRQSSLGLINLDLVQMHADEDTHVIGLGLEICNSSDGIGTVMNLGNIHVYGIATQNCLHHATISSIDDACITTKDQRPYMFYSQKQ